jgi:hypothetical protein
MFPKSRKETPPMSVEAATDMVRKMVQRESRGWGDLDNAMERLERRYGLPFWTVWRHCWPAYRARISICARSTRATY